MIVLANTATILLAAGSLWLTIQAARTCKGSVVLCWLAAFFGAWATYRVYWVWWWWIGSPYQYATGWPVTAMLWVIVFALFGLIVALHRKSI